ncbi:hypothetical protein [Marinobacter caseinilyticus]|uniref:hypothetical protein n=1 Tax=Marinobacter caseinilyticus TaxID=2692195 RepID=UPI0014095616|nr:hypothetical protein [Marinobacter caseinilyticus]
MFQLVFKGECTPGTELDQARDNARSLFKASLDQIDRMFSGQSVVIRNKLDEAQAAKYRAVLHKHGLVSYVERMPGAEPAPKPMPPSPAEASSIPAPPAREPQISASQRAPQEGAAKSSTDVPAREPGDRLDVAGDQVDTILSGSGLSLDPVGVTLMPHQEVEPPMFQHLDAWTLAPAGSELTAKREAPPPIVPDVSHLSLVDDERKTTE